MNPDDFLNESEVQALTGESAPARQVGVLARNGYPFIFTGNAVRLLHVVAKGRQIVPELGQAWPDPGRSVERR